MLRQVAREAGISRVSARIFCMRRLSGIDAGARDVGMRTSPPPMPQIVDDSAPIVSSDRPKTLPTSRIAERPR